MAKYDFNQVVLSGNVVREPEVKEYKSGKETKYLTRFSIAVNAGENVSYFDVVSFNKVGDYLKKGQKVYVTGRLVQSSYEKEGKKQYRIEIHANQVGFGAQAGEKGESEPVAALEQVPF
jgi:single stranded DNA-binding protein